MNLQQAFTQYCLDNDIEPTPAQYDAISAFLSSLAAYKFRGLGTGKTFMFELLDRFLSDQFAMSKVSQPLVSHRKDFSHVS